MSNARSSKAGIAILPGTHRVPQCRQGNWATVRQPTRRKGQSCRRTGREQDAAAPCGNSTRSYWATRCGPCRKDIQVLTISVDDAASPAAAYVKAKEDTFPVIHAPALADKLLGYAYRTRRRASPDSGRSRRGCQNSTASSQTLARSSGYSRRRRERSGRW
jgi:hypothetical protein